MMKKIFGTAALIAAMAGVAGCESIQGSSSAVHVSAHDITSVTDIAKSNDIASYTTPPAIMIDAVTLSGTKIVINPKPNEPWKMSIYAALKGNAKGANGFALNVDGCELYMSPSIAATTVDNVSGDKSAHIYFTPHGIRCEKSASGIVAADMTGARIQVMTHDMQNMIKVPVVTTSAGEYAELPAGIPVKLILVDAVKFEPRAAFGKTKEFAPRSVVTIAGLYSGASSSFVSGEITPALTAGQRLMFSVDNGSTWRNLTAEDGQWNACCNGPAVRITEGGSKYSLITPVSGNFNIMQAKVVDANGASGPLSQRYYQAGK